MPSRRSVRLSSPAWQKQPLLACHAPYESFLAGGEAGAARARPACSQVWPWWRAAGLSTAGETHFSWSLTSARTLGRARARADGPGTRLGGKRHPAESHEVGQGRFRGLSVSAAARRSARQVLVCETVGAVHSCPRSPAPSAGKAFEAAEISKVACDSGYTGRMASPQAASEAAGRTPGCDAVPCHKSTAPPTR